MLIFEKSMAGRTAFTLDQTQVPHYELNAQKRETPASLPEVSEIDVIRHYTALSKKAHGVDDGFYPLGSCTMKYNPRINEKVASFDGFTRVHPLQDEKTVEGCTELMDMLTDRLCAITGMDAMTLQPAAGAHGEFTGIMLIKAYHQDRKDTKRTKIIVPDSAHGTNPASAHMCGYDIVSVPSNNEGGVDIEALKAVVGPDTAGLMLTNPNTLGLFDKNILEITEIVHKAGGLCYYDGANLNAIMGVVRPGDMGFDVMHLNIHKTFSTPHGGGGPGAGPVGCKKILANYLPVPVYGTKPQGYNPKKSIGKVKTFYGNFSVLVKGAAYIDTLGREGIKDAAQKAVLNANYLMKGANKYFDLAYDGRICMHEFVLCLQGLKDETGVSAMDVAKGMLDYGMHPPTMYFPLIVHEALMLEPTETETKETLDEAIEVLKTLKEKALTQPEVLHDSPLTTYIGRVDEVRAARQPILKYEPKN
ncbi:MAG: aminomethyl-transferring glycine dehydrogenase subunit GcvPB [Clostridia bacterium]|nr:aminomethyl-transferring glycine dehydrogenase subunit GcvPB [Clostridia bacterium]